MAYGFVTVLPGVRCCFMLYVVVQCYITVISYDVDGGALGCALYCIMLYGVAWCCLRFHGVVLRGVRFWGCDMDMGSKATSLVPSLGGSLVRYPR